MTTIELTTLIEAPVETCFDLSLSIDLELKAARSHQIRAVSGVTSGIIGFGQRVGWKTKQFGIPISHVSEITGFQQPNFFQDRMVKGVFEFFQHDHFFEPLGTNRTEMRDSLRFSMPFWLMGAISERLVVQSRLTQLLRMRNSAIKEAAEALSPEVANLAVEIVSFVDDYQPGIVTCEFFAVDGRRHTIVEKAPVVSVEDLNADSTFPRRGGVRCIVLGRWRDSRERSLARISTENPHHIESSEGVSEFVVLESQLSALVVGDV